MSRALIFASLAVFTLGSAPALGAADRSNATADLRQSRYENQEECYRAYGCLLPGSENPFCPDASAFEVCEQYPE